MRSSSIKIKIKYSFLAFPNENNVDAKHAEKLQKYYQLAFEVRERTRVQE